MKSRPLDVFEQQLLEEERTAISRRKLFQEFRNLPREKMKSFLADAGTTLALQESFEAQEKLEREEAEAKKKSEKGSSAV